MFIIKNMINMFYIIGIGLTVKQITKQAIDVISTCDDVYIDGYTNIFSEGEIKDLEEIISKKIILLNREELEQKQEYLKDNCCLLVIGNVFSATTHFTIINDARKKNLSTKTIAGLSIFNYKSCCGLSEYRFGKTTSIVYPEKNYFPTSFYNTIVDNLKIDAHSFCLLDIKTDQQKFMSVKEACEILEKIDVKNLLTNQDCVLLAGVGGNKQTIKSFVFKDHIKISCDIYPQTLIICSKLNSIEKEGLDECRL